MVGGKHERYSNRDVSMGACWARADRDVPKCPRVYPQDTKAQQLQAAVTSRFHLKRHSLHLFTIAYGVLSVTYIFYIPFITLWYRSIHIVTDRDRFDRIDTKILSTYVQILEIHKHTIVYDSRFSCFFPILTDFDLSQHCNPRTFT